MLTRYKIVRNRNNWTTFDGGTTMGGSAEVGFDRREELEVEGEGEGCRG